MKKFLKRVISVSARNSVREALVWLNIKFIRLFAINGFLASLYYTFFSRRFYREHKAVLQGRLSYYSSLVSVGESCALLRRNIHRLEKGLIMRPRYEVFAKDYILETVHSLRAAIQSQLLCSAELKWATDVLICYFGVVGIDKEVDKAREIFSGLVDQDKLHGHMKSTPYLHRDLPECPISYSDLLKLLIRRRSVRWYLDKHVDIDLIRKAVYAAGLAPSACNRQAFNFLVINNRSKANEIADCAMGTVGFAHNLPCVIAVVGDLAAYPAERDRHLIYIDGALAAMQLMLAFETLGLSTCPINWPDIESRERLLSKKLKLSYHQRTIMLLAVGYAMPEGGIAFSQKKSENILLKEAVW